MRSNILSGAVIAFLGCAGLAQAQTYTIELLPENVIANSDLNNYTEAPVYQNVMNDIAAGRFSPSSGVISMGTHLSLGHRINGLGDVAAEHYGISGNGSLVVYLANGGTRILSFFSNELPAHIGGINDRAIVVGSTNFDTPDFASHPRGFVADAHNYRRYNMPGFASSILAVNNRNKFGGYVYEQAECPVYRPAAWRLISSPGTELEVQSIPLSFPPQMSGSIVDVNDHDQAGLIGAPYSFPFYEPEFFVIYDLNSHITQTVSDPDNQILSAVSMNNRREVLGFHQQTRSSPRRIFVHREGRFLDLSNVIAPNGGSAEDNHFPLAINDKGEILAAVSNHIQGILRFYILTPQAGSFCAADLNGSGRVDMQDLNLLLANFGALSGWLDLNGDRRVTFSDISVLLANFGACAHTGREAA